MKKQQKKIEQLLKYKTVLKKIAQVFKGKCMYSAAKNFCSDVGIEVSIGTLAKWFKQYCPGCYQIHYGYGTGKGAVQGRILTEKFTCRSDGEKYLKHNGKWQKEYIVKMEDQLKKDKQLLKQINSDTDLVVHHKNGDHYDNRRANLKVMSRVEHSRLHMKKQWKGIYIYDYQRYKTYE